MLKAGAAQIDTSPKDSQFLFGYPHVERYSTGIHDRLWSSAFYLSDGNEQVLFIANDIIFISKEIAKSIRNEISKQTGMKPENIMITATHTHSGPSTVDYASVQADPIVPKADQKYVEFMKDCIVQAGIEAVNAAQDAKIGLGIADDTGVGTNRRNPNGPADHQVPVLLVKNAKTNDNIVCMLVCSMHPTVMHEDSTLVSGDFPGLARIYLQKNVVGEDCSVLHHTGPAGNQSPRHVTNANTFDEAERLGNILGKAVEKSLANIKFKDDLKLSVITDSLNDLPRKSFPSVKEAENKLQNAVQKLQQLRENNAPKQDIRTAECDWFGAEEVLTLSKAAQDGSLEKAYQSCLPAEIQIIRIGDWNFVGWPGEIFIEYALQVKTAEPNTFVISLSNGEMQGYIATQEAAKEGGYEASNALFNYETGNIFVNRTLQLIKNS
jgi:hypothetical protein